MVVAKKITKNHIDDYRSQDKSDSNLSPMIYSERDNLEFRIKVNICG